MQRRRFKDVLTIPDRLILEAEHLRAEAKKLPPGAERHELEREPGKPRPLRTSTSG